MAKKTGTSTSGIEQSARYKRRRARQRRDEEAAWAARSGPVIVYTADDVRSDPEASADDEQTATVDGDSSSSSPAC